MDRRLSILRCPITKTSLRELHSDEIMELNARILRGTLFHFDGSAVRKQVTAGFVSADSQFAYSQVEGILLLLQNLAIVLDLQEAGEHPGADLRAEKKDVQAFYDEIGWRKGESDVFVDTSKFEDLRPVSKDYIHKCHLRVVRHLKPSGRYFLDVASGPIPYPEYLTYSDSFDYRICVDLSFLALKEAQKKAGEKGIYILGDITRLPFEDNCVDAAVSLHTIYHVPADEQRRAFHEIYRVLKPGSSAVVVYSWGGRAAVARYMQVMDPFHRRVLGFPRSLRKSLGREAAGQQENRQREIRETVQESAGAESKLYFHAHPYGWFTSELGRSLDFEIRVWRSVSVLFMQTYVHSWTLGRAVLALIYWLEERFPHLTGRLGQYPMMVLKKAAARDLQSPEAAAGAD